MIRGFLKTLLWTSSSLCWSAVAWGALPGPGEDSAAAGQSGVAPRYLTNYTHLVDGVSWAGHLDTELFSNFSGGIKRGASNDTAGQLGLQWDSEKSGIWKGGQFNLSTFATYSSAEQTDFSGDQQVASNIYAATGIRLYEANYRQQWTLWLATRVGFTDFNLYFDVASNALQLINSSFGLTPTISVNVPAAPTYPYSGLGFIVSTHGSNWSSKAGIFQGDALHPWSGTFDRGYLALWEGALHLGREDGDDPDDDTDTFGQWVFKLGAWHYQQPRFDVIEDLGPSSSGLYGVVEAHYDVGGAQVGPFLQWGASTATQNIVPWYLGVGTKIAHFVPGRPDDALSIGFARAGFRAAALQNALGLEASEDAQDAPAGTRLRSAETAYEITYVAKLNEHVSIQPDLQYITHPSGIYPNALVGILRLHLEFS